MGADNNGDRKDSNTDWATAVALLVAAAVDIVASKLPDLKKVGASRS